jgi:hypothetical protein
MIGPRLLGARPVVSARRKQRPSVLVASRRAIQPICVSLQLSCPETKSAIHPFFSYETFIRSISFPQMQLFLRNVASV